MNEIRKFENSDLGNLRTVLVNDEPWFIGKDVAAILGYRETAKAIREHVDEEDKGVSVLDTPGGKQSMTIINESGLYSMILSSKLPTARQFKRWVTHDVLPAIRQTGVYVSASLSQQIIQDPDTLFLILEQLRQERTARLEAEQTAQSTKNQLAIAHQRIEQLRPAPVFVFDGDPDAASCCSVSELARQLSTDRHKVTRRELFANLRDKGYIQKNAPLPTPYGIESGYFLIMEKRSGSSRYYTAAVTLAGQLHFSTIYM